VGILNRRRPALWQLLRSRPWQYDVVHLYDDSRTKLWTRLYGLFKVRLLVTTQDGYAAFPDRWSRRFAGRFDALGNGSAFLPPSEQIAALAKERGFTCPVHVHPNGLYCNEMRFVPEAAHAKAVVLGKVEPRKKQEFLAETLRGLPVECDLIGPLGADTPPDFDGNGANVRRRGEWTRREVCEHLTDYAALVLLSDGEAHPLVVIEALAAGCSVVVSEEASANLDTALPFVKVVDRGDRAAVAHAIASAVAGNAAHRAAIRAYAETTFDWSVILPRYQNFIASLKVSPSP
ncbi:MAG: glycosyltransferase, partial [Armatimonadetes bacterium]|nr:glycosyltransferase [Armatimonadota bacterium]